MTGTLILDVARDGIYTFLMIGAPVMLVALGVGLAISLVQALTQIQEQTLVFVPKIIAVFTSLLIFLPLMSDALGGYMNRIAERIVSGG
jgi:flagellar biosynthesis protein FliQ